MTDDLKVPPPLDALVRVVTGGSADGDDDERAMTFARGLALGALVGAAIAGSTLWQRRQARLTARGEARSTAGPAATLGGLRAGPPDRP